MKSIWLWLLFLPFCVWSQLPNINKIEYFIDNDPGLGSATNVPVTAGTHLSDVTFSIPVNSLTAGFHVLYVRSKDANDKWSLTASRHFYKPAASEQGTVSQVNKVEYFIDIDPGLGSATNVPVTAGTNLSDVTFSIQVNSLTEGFHVLYVRSKDANDKWSLTASRHFYKAAASTLSNITKIEYFVDSDPGEGNAVNVPVTPAPNIEDKLFMVDVGRLTIGAHKLYVRTQDATGKWSLRAIRTFDYQQRTFYKDLDSDGWGDNNMTVQSTTGAPTGYVAYEGDCNDNNSNIHPNAAEICGNSIDENCNGMADDAFENNLVASHPNLTCTQTAITLTVSGGSTYLWDNGATTATRTITNRGTYQVSITDARNCTIQRSIVIGEDRMPPTDQINASAMVLTCAVRQVTLAASNGQTYLWDDNTTTPTRVVAESGTYRVTVTGANGCTQASSINITQNIDPPTVTLTAPTVELNCTTRSIELTANGNGTYRWEDNSTDANRMVTTAGTYSVTVTGTNGCATNRNIVILSSVNPPTAIITAATTELNCTRTNIPLVASGGHSYRWDDNSTSANRVVTTAGTYTVTVMGSNGCTALQNITISSNTNPPNALITAPTTELNCVTTQITLTATGGIQYRWDNNSYGAQRIVTSAGTYVVTVTGANGCTAVQNIAITSVGIPVATLSASATALNCTVTSITLIAGGGDTYRWNDNTTSATRTITAAGNYSVTVTGANGCTASQTLSISQDRTEPALAFTNVPVLGCNPNWVVLRPSFVSDITSYRWSDNSTSDSLRVTTQGTYTLTVTGTNGCTTSRTVPVTQDTIHPGGYILNTLMGDTLLTCVKTSLRLVAHISTPLLPNTYRWDNDSTTVYRNVTSSGIYVVTVTGSNGCTSVFQTTIRQDTTRPIVTLSTPNGTELNCVSNSISVTAMSADFRSTFQWSHQNNNGPFAAFTSAGTYTVTVTGWNSCTHSRSITITRDTTTPNADLTATRTVLSCQNPNAVLTISGGATYRWSTSETTSMITVTRAGIYAVTVTGANGCTALRNVTITGNATLPTAQINSLTTVLNCTTSSIVLTASGGTRYRWNTNDTTTSITVNLGGTYSVTVTSDNGCSATTNRTITVASELRPTISGNLTICDSSSTTLTASNIVGASYLWSNGQTTPSITVMAGGTYQVEVSTSNTCRGSASVPVVTRPLPTIVITGNLRFCNGTQLTASGGVSYQWSNGQTTPTIDVIVPTSGTYTVTATNNFGCRASRSVTTEVVPPPQAGFTEIIQGGAVQFTNRTTGGIRYDWDFGNGSTSTLANPVIQYLNNGTYRVCLMATSMETCVDRHCHELTISRVATQELETSVQVWLSPNPTAGFLTVDVDGYESSYTLKVTNVTGHLVWKQRMEKSRSVLELDNQPNGIYFLTVETNKGEIIKRFVIQK